MSLMHPSLAWGLLCGLIPLIIYLVFRRRYRVVRWAAMDLLLAAIRKRYRNVRLQDMILLALRTLALVLAATVVARPMLSTAGTGRDARVASSDGPDAVIILDTSYSMGTNTAARDRMEPARKAAQTVLSALPESSRAGLVLMADRAVRATDGLCSDRARIRGAVEAAEMSFEGTDAAPAVAAALDMLKASKAGSKRVFMITDGQRGAFERQIDQLRRMLLESDPSIQFVVITTPAGPAPNLAVCDLEVASRSFRTGEPVQFDARVEDMGQLASAEAHAELWLDGRKVDRKAFHLENRKAAVSFRFTFTAPGLYGIEVRLDADGLDADNHRYAAVCIPASMAMLVVTPDQAAPSENAHVFADAALAASNESREEAGGLPWVVRPRMSRDRLADELDAAVWSVALADPGTLSGETLKRLETFVAQGGSVLFAAGPEATATLGSMRSGRVASGVASEATAGIASGAAADWMSDLIISAPASAPGDEKRFLQILPELTAKQPGPAMLDLASPGVRESFSAVRVFEAIAVELVPDSRWSVALRFTDGRPAMLVRDVPPGGRLALWASSLDTAWTDLPYRPAYVALLQDLLTWLNMPRLVSASISPGEYWSPIVPRSDDEVRDAVQGWKVQLPDGNRLEAGLFAEAGNDQVVDWLRVDRTQRPGVHRLVREAPGQNVASTALHAVAVNVDIRESNAALWSEARLRDLFPPGRLEVMAAGDALDTSMLIGAGGRELWPGLAALLAVTLLIEMLLAYRFSYQKSAPASATSRSRAPISEGARA